MCQLLACVLSMINMSGFESKLAENSSNLITVKM